MNANGNAIKNENIAVSCKNKQINEIIALTHFVIKTIVRKNVSIVTGTVYSRHITMHAYATHEMKIRLRQKKKIK